VRRSRLIPLALAIGLAAAAATLIARSSAGGGPSARPHTAQTKAQTTKYTAYSLGSSFEGLPLTAKLRRLEDARPGERFGPDFFSYIYGDCKATGDRSCPSPLEVQSWAACKRNLSSYALTPDGRPLPHRNTKIRGVPAAIFEDGYRLEVYTGRTTVVIFGVQPTQIRRAADAIRAVGASKTSTLPPPAPGALQGKLAC
jgi:hypothetical protein